MKGEINTAANFQGEFESENATKAGNLDCLANSLSSLNTKLKNSAEIKDKKKEVPFSSRRSSSHVLEFFSNESVEINIQDEMPCATRSEPGIAGMFRGING